MTLFAAEDAPPVSAPQEFISHALTSFASGWTVVIQGALPAVHYALYFGFRVPVIAACATARQQLRARSPFGSSRLAASSLKGCHSSPSPRGVRCAVASSAVTFFTAVYVVPKLVAQVVAEFHK